MNAWKALLFAWISSAIGGAFGALVGRFLGKEIPSYYVSVFDGYKNPRFDPLAVGLGPGASQGMLVGSLGGVAIMFIFAWREVKLAGKD